jgi:iron complex outermembrane receptor protein
MKNKLLAQCVMTLTFLLVSFIVVAQTKVLKGKVVDETQGPLAGATIKVKGNRGYNNRHGRFLYIYCSQ